MHCTALLRFILMYVSINTMLEFSQHCFNDIYQSLPSLCCAVCAKFKIIRYKVLSADIKYVNEISLDSDPNKKNNSTT